MKMPGKIQRTTSAKIDTNGLKGLVFANEIILNDPIKSLGGVRFVLRASEIHTTPEPGRHIFPLENETTQKFLRLLENYESKENIELRELHIVETGLSVRNAGDYHYPQVSSDLIRILINLREKTEHSHVALGLTIEIAKGKKKVVWLQTHSSYATVLPGCLSELTIISSKKDIPGTRQENGKSIYLIMDVFPKKDTQYLIAEKLAAQNPDMGPLIIARLKKMYSDGKISKEEFEELLKNPEKALGKLTSTSMETHPEEVVPAQPEEVVPAQPEEVVQG